jgi:spermidine synthase
VAKALRQAKLDDEFAVLGSVVAGPQVLKEFSRGAAVNTDDLPVVTHRAPWVSYSPQETPRDRLASLMQQVSPLINDVLGAEQNKDAMRLEAYWQARAKYLAFGVTVRPDADPRVMLDRLRLPLLDMVAISPDFRPASEPLLALAEAVRETDPVLSAQVKSSLQSALSSPPSRPLVTPLVNLK